MFAAVYIPEFPIVAWLRAEPACRRFALAVIEGTSPLEHIVSLNRAAQQLGVEHGMCRVQAETAGPLQLRPRNLAAEEKAFAVAVEGAERFSPRVEAIASPDNHYAGSRSPGAALLIDGQGTEVLFGPPQAYASQLHAALNALGFPASVAVTGNAEASLLLGRSCRGVLSVKDHELEAKLAPLPLSALSCDADTLAVLDRWGIRKLGELARLPKEALISRLGQQGHRLQQLARGTAERLLVPEEPEFTLNESVALDAPLELLESLLFILSPMLERLLGRAREHAYGLRSLKLQLQLERAQEFSLVIKPALPATQRDLLLRLLNLELQAHPPQSGIVGLTLSAEPAPPQLAQRGLFQTQFPEPDRLDLLLARLRSIAGEPNVGSPALLNSHVEDAFVLQAFEPAAALAPAYRGSLRLALRRCRQAQPVRVVVRDRLPALLFWHGAPRAIRAVAGPWHSSGCWWDERRWEHEEWDAIVADPPEALRLQQDAASQAWHIVGVYD